MLNFAEFGKLIELGPLVSIDLLVETKQGVLLGMRNNKPAKGFWFAPGGRILKNETFAEALQRISQKELGITLTMEDINFHGFYEHFYEDSFVADNISTHYVVLAFKYQIDQINVDLPQEQHLEYRFFSTQEIIDNKLVHNHTKEYFL